MRTIPAVCAILALLVTLPTSKAGNKDTGLTDEGFITRWVILVPIPLGEGVSSLQGLAKEQVKGEAKLQPKDGDKVKVGDKELVWKQHTTKEHVIDFNAIVGGPTDDSVAYAVTYIHAEVDMNNIRLKIGSDDQAMAYLNGKEVLINEKARPLDKDQNAATVSLKRGMNVLVLKVINERVDWAACARFTDINGAAIKNLQVTAAPK